MRRTSALATGVLSLAGGLVLAGGTPALAVCDGYSQACPSPAAEASPPSSVEGGGSTGNPGTGPKAPPRTTTPTKPTRTTVNRRTTPASTANTLPFTGGELVLLSTLGGAALAGGTVLVVAGRRRTPRPTR